MAEASKERTLREHSENFSKQIGSELEALKVAPPRPRSPRPGGARLEQRARQADVAGQCQPDVGTERARDRNVPSWLLSLLKTKPIHFFLFIVSPSK